jgi:hypothetical protein
MPPAPRRALAALALASLASSCAHPAPPKAAPAAAPAADLAPPILASVDAAALDGDVREALRRLDAIPEASLGAERERAACLRRTFGARDPAPSGVTGALAAPVAAAYRAYWTRVLLREVDAEAGAAELEARLRQVLARAGHPQPEAATLDDVTEALGPLLLADGYHSVRGVTLPYHELILWRGESTRTYDVALPEEAVAVQVVFMEGFALRGWSAFATCGSSFAGGWTTDDALYCAADAYDTASETFAVSYLGHEAQHFLDRRRWPGMEQPELEYRAKLAELALARTTGRALLARFGEQMGEDRRVPHAFANRRVVADLSRALLGSRGAAPDAGALEGVPAPELARAARALLLADSAARPPAGRAPDPTYAPSSREKSTSSRFTTTP